jgi:hypothetical protein
MHRIRQALIENGVKNLREFGYPECNAKNIFTDDIYALMFVGMLNDNKGKNDIIDREIESILSEINL